MKGKEGISTKRLQVAKLFIWLLMAIVLLPELLYVFQDTGKILGNLVIGRRMRPLFFIILVSAFLLFPLIELLPRCAGYRKIPLPIMICLTNFALLSMLTLGLVRFVIVIDYLFILVALQFLIEWILEANTSFHWFSATKWTEEMPRLTWRRV